ncbi:hypothetical protein BGZ96_007219 [Linnemannia gamsii]|uniref:Secreted protein n=1 Tax=Linnemannia gamsii TaxID=64522 RepID=A0ABQ7K1L1_9FUNG|nr:hypothetical protein BGZ96_007219 [Linnemannia gamsii]
MAVADVLRLVHEALKYTLLALFALGNATFWTGINLTSVHTTFLRRPLHKGVAFECKVALVDHVRNVPNLRFQGETTRLAKPLSASLAISLL